MNKNHPHWKLAKKELSIIFANLSSPKCYPTISKLKDQFKKWEKKFSSISVSQILTEKEKILLLGKI